MTAASSPIFKGCLALLMVLSSVMCACTTAAAPKATTQPAEPPCCQKSPASHGAVPAEPTPGHEDCPHCNGKLTADTPSPAPAKHLADLPVLAIGLIAAFEGVLPLNMPALSTVLATPITASAALPARLHCALVL